MSEATEQVFCVRITEANHAENEFFTLGGAGFPTEAERQASIDAIPKIGPGHDCRDPAVQRCYIVDVLDPGDQFTVIDDFEITEETAHALLGVENFDPLRDRERALFAAAMAGVSR